MENIKTLTEMLKESVKKYKEKPAFKIKKKGKFVPVSFEEIYNRIKSFGTGLIQIGIKQLDHVGLISGNRLEWIISDLAIIHLKAADVPCSENSSPQDILFKLNHSDANATILEGEKQFLNFLKIKENLPAIKNIILLDKIEVFAEKDETPEWAISVNFQKDNQISSKFKKSVRNFIKHKNIVLFLSPKAKSFLENCLDNNKEELLGKLNTGQSINLLKLDFCERIITIDRKFEKPQHFNIYSFQKISEIGKNELENGNNCFEEIAKTVQEDDLATIIYTSGTTSNPKGVMLTHSNFIHNLKAMPPVQKINGNDRFLSILPSWHIFERTAEYLSLTVGASTAYSKPFKQVLLPDLIAEQPTIMTSVPRIWESVYKGAITKARKGSNIKRIIFDWAFDTGKKYKRAERILNQTLPLFDKTEFSPEEIRQAKRTITLLGWQYQLADKLVFKKIREVTGGKLRFAISGGGALPGKVDNFFDVAGIMVCEGYGLTETSPVLCARNPEHCIISTVGPSLPEVEIKIADKNDLDMEVSHGEIGTVMTKGPMVMKGYYKNEKKTNEVIKDDWFNTGDLGRKTKDGKYLQLVGRSKDTIVLRGGENIEPQPLEDRLLESEYVNMVVVVGQDRARLGAIIVPNFDKLKAYLEKERIKLDNLNELIKHPKIVSLFQNEIKRLISREYGFKPYETVMGLALCPHDFSIETGELTETLKVKRFEIHKKFEEIINNICGQS